MPKRWAFVTLVAAQLVISLTCLRRARAPVKATQSLVLPQCCRENLNVKYACARWSWFQHYTQLIHHHSLIPKRDKATNLPKSYSYLPLVRRVSSQRSTKECTHHLLLALREHHVGSTRSLIDPSRSNDLFISPTSNLEANSLLNSSLLAMPRLLHVWTTEARP